MKNNIIFCISKIKSGLPLMWRLIMKLSLQNIFIKWKFLKKCTKSFFNNFLFLHEKNVIFPNFCWMTKIPILLHMTGSINLNISLICWFLKCLLFGPKITVFVLYFLCVKKTHFPTKRYFIFKTVSRSQAPFFLSSTLWKCCFVFENRFFLFQKIIFYEIHFRGSTSYKYDFSTKIKNVEPFHT